VDSRDIGLDINSDDDEVYVKGPHSNAGHLIIDVTGCILTTGDDGDCDCPRYGCPLATSTRSDWPRRARRELADPWWPPQHFVAGPAPASPAQGGLVRTKLLVQMRLPSPIWKWQEGGSSWCPFRRRSLRSITSTMTATTTTSWALGSDWLQGHFPSDKISVTAKC
jgi:hypothetical protein